MLGVSYCQLIIQEQFILASRGCRSFYRSSLNLNLPEVVSNANFRIFARNASFHVHFYT